MNKLNLLFDGRVLKWGLSNGTRNGIYFVAKNIIQVLAKKNNVDLSLYLPKSDLPIGQDLINSLNLKNMVLVSDDSDLSQINAFLSPLYKCPDIVMRYPNISCYTILHDVTPLIFPEYFANCDNAWFKELIDSLKYEDFYFSNSDYTKSDFLKYCSNIDSEKITTIPLSTNLPYTPNKDAKRLANVCQKYNIPNDKKYLFSLCSLEQRKNLIRSVKTFIQFIEKNNIDDLVYILGGGAWDGFVEKLEKEVPDYNKYSDKIIRAGYVADEDLEILYSNAQWFIYTSQYEGFGMPPLEAMACGCPVITSNNSSLPEVVGDAGIMIDWDSDEQHIAAYEKYYMDEKYRKEMADKGLARSKLFSWEKTVDIILNKMQEIEKLKNNQPLVTIITPTFNLIKGGRKETFVQSVTSAHNQTYKNIEHIVIDGASNDGTIDLLKEYQDMGWIKYYSEPDKGLYDGINKGILKANGKYVVVLNSDDFYCDEKAVEMLVRKAEELNADAVCAGAKSVEAETMKLRGLWSCYETKNLIFGTHACHQTFLIKTDVMKELGLYDLKYKVSADTAFMYKMLNANKYIAMIEPIIITYRLGGVSADADAVKKDVTDALFENYGQYHNLTKLDAINLVYYNFLNIPLENAIALGSKLPEPQWREEYFRLLIKNNVQNTNITNAYNFIQKKMYLFDIIPLLKTKFKYGVKRYLLCGFLPVLKIKYNNDKIKSYLFSVIPFTYTSRQKFRIFGIPVVSMKH